MDRALRCKCKRCKRELDFGGGAGEISCCGVRYICEKEGNVSYFYSAEIPKPLERFAIPIAIFAFIFSCVLVHAGIFTTRPWTLLSIAAVVVVTAFQFVIWCALAHGWLESRESRDLPFSNFEFERVLLIASACHIIVSLLIASGVIPAGECHESRLFSTC